MTSGKDSPAESQNDRRNSLFHTETSQNSSGDTLMWVPMRLVLIARECMPDGVTPGRADPLDAARHEVRARRLQGVQHDLAGRGWAACRRRRQRPGTRPWPARCPGCGRSRDRRWARCTRMNLGSSAAWRWAIVGAAVGRAVVHHDHFEVGHGLGGDGPQAVGEQVLVVVKRHNNADLRTGHGVALFPGACGHACIYAGKPKKSGAVRSLYAVAWLLAAPDGRPLLREGDRALHRVRRDEHRTDDLALPGERLVAGPVRGLDNDSLGGGERKRGSQRNPRRQFPGAGQCLAGADQLLTRPACVQAIGGEVLAGQRDLHGQVVRDPARQPEQAARAGHQARA